MNFLTTIQYTYIKYIAGNIFFRYLDLISDHSFQRNKKNYNIFCSIITELTMYLICSIAIAVELN